MSDLRRYVSRGRALTPRERELVIILIEEANEVAHAGAKLLRFGVGDVTPGQHLGNDVTLGMEIGDLMIMISLAIRDNLVAPGSVERGKERKLKRLEKYTEFLP